MALAAPCVARSPPTGFALVPDSRGPRLLAFTPSQEPWLGPPPPRRWLPRHMLVLCVISKSFLIPAMTSSSHHELFGAVVLNSQTYEDVSFPFIFTSHSVSLQFSVLDVCGDSACRAGVSVSVPECPGEAAPPAASAWPDLLRPYALARPVPDRRVSKTCCSPAGLFSPIRQPSFVS